MRVRPSVYDEKGPKKGDDYRGHRVLRIDGQGTAITNISVLSQNKYDLPGAAQSHVLKCEFRLPERLAAVATV